jgi:hypothetical protein
VADAWPARDDAVVLARQRARANRRGQRCARASARRRAARQNVDLAVVVDVCERDAIERHARMEKVNV